MKRFFLVLICCAAITPAFASKEDCRALAAAQKQELDDETWSLYGIGWMNSIARSKLLGIAEKHYAQSIKICAEQTK